jgi:hypothetical protein
MDDRYRRAEAIEAHKNLRELIKANEIRDLIIESKMEGHIQVDKEIHDREKQ